MRYAAYGSNLHPLRLSKRVPSAQLVSTGFLPDWSLHFHKLSKDESGKCNIQFGGDGVHLAIFEISPGDKLALDQIEGVGFGYAEINLYIPGVGECASYVAMESHIDDSLRPYDWYKELVLIGARSHVFPNDYVDVIESVPACSDPDPERRQEYSRLIQLLTTGR